MIRHSSYDELRLDLEEVLSETFESLAITMSETARGVQIDGLKPYEKHEIETILSLLGYAASLVEEAQMIVYQGEDA